MKPTLDRRKFLYVGIAAGLCVILSFSGCINIVKFHARRVNLKEFGGGYTPVTSIDRGSVLPVFYHSTEEVEADLVRLGEWKELISTYKMPASIQDKFYHPFKGFSWKNSFELPTDDLKGGYYYLHLKSKGHRAVVPFIVKSGKNVGVTLVASTNTWNAYNSYVCGNYGGDAYPRYIEPKIPFLSDVDKCLSWFANKFGYTTSVPDYLVPLPLPQNRPISWANQILSINEPTRPNGGHLLDAEWATVHFFEKNNIPYRVISDSEFHSSYKPQKKEITIFHAHSEYWSERMKENLKKHYNDGRAMFFFSGNSIYRDVEHYKGGIKVVSQESSRRRTENIIGSFYDPGGYNTWAPYKVVNREHWIFEGLSKEIEFFGKNDPTNKYDGASGFETDKMKKINPAFLVAQGTNPGSNGRRGGADMIVKENDAGGIIFNASSVSFTSSINGDPTIRLIIRNLFRRAGRPINIPQN